MNAVVEGAIAVAGGYLIGAISPAVLIARAKGFDLRSAGSGNPGATNAGRTLGTKIGVVVALLDILKGFVPAALASHYWGLQFGMLAGLAATLGHVTSPFLGFRGGKGVATAGGAILGTRPVWCIPVLLVFLVAFAITRKVGLSSVAAAASLVPVALIEGGPWWSTAFAASLAVVIIVRHRRNLSDAFHRN